MRKLPIALALALFMGFTADAGWAQNAEPKVKVLTSPEDATKKTVLVGRAPAGGMVVTFELEPAKAMLMQMGAPGSWMPHPPAKDEIFHVEVKPVDPRSKTRISYAEVEFNAVNRTNNQKIKLTLHPMWGGSGLHYAANSGLAGDGIYTATITVGVPAFTRDVKDKDVWMKPASARFHFKLTGGKLTEVSQPADDAQK